MQIIKKPLISDSNCTYWLYFLCTNKWGENFGTMVVSILENSVLNNFAVFQMGGAGEMYVRN